MMKNLSLINLILDEVSPSKPGLYKSRGEYIDIPSRSHMVSGPYDPETRRISSEIYKTPFVPVVALTEYLIKYIQSAVKNISSQTTPDDPHYISPSYLIDLKLIIKELNGFIESIKDRYYKQFEFPTTKYTKRLFVPSSVYKDESGKTIYRPITPVYTILNELISELEYIIKFSKKYKTKPTDIDFISVDELTDMRKVIRELKIFQSELKRKFSDQLDLPTFQSI